MSTFVLVHPAWMGGWCWSAVATSLRRAGHDVHTPTMTGLGDRCHLARPSVGLGTHVDDIATAVYFEDLHDVTLVGTSSSGVVATASADRLVERIARVVYLDAFVPENGQSVLDMLAPPRRSEFEALVDSEGDGWMVPRFGSASWETIIRGPWQITDDRIVGWMLERLRPTPLGHFAEPAELSGRFHELELVYVRCPRFPHAGFDGYAAAAASNPRWELRELDASHIPYISDPDEVTDLLTDVANVR